MIEPLPAALLHVGSLANIQHEHLTVYLYIFRRRCSQYRNWRETTLKLSKYHFDKYNIIILDKEAMIFLENSCFSIQYDCVRIVMHTHGMNGDEATLKNNMVEPAWPPGQYTIIFSR